MADYIDREAALAETRKPRLTDAELRRRLASIPAADVAPVIHAEWFDFSDPVLKWQFTCYCSNCHEKSIRRYPYCPGCGARMDKDNNGKSKS